MRAYPHPKTGLNAGFSLIQICLLLTVASVLVVSIMPGGDRSSDFGRDKLTIERMQKIEEAMQAFMAKNLRRPCPSDVTLAASSAGMGVTAVTTTAPPFVCSNGFPVASFINYVATGATGTEGTNTVVVSSASGIEEGDYMLYGTPYFIAQVTDVSGTTITLDAPLPTTLISSSVPFYRTPVVAGGVPTRTLGLPDEYGLDGYGRRIMYAVDIRAATAQGCSDMRAEGKQGALSLLDSSGEVSEKVMWALLSYGKKAHGAVGPQGVADLASRFNTGSTDTDTRINAFVDGSFTTSFTGELVRKESTEAFDDIVWVDKEMKNECCVGKRCKMATTIKLDTDYYRINGVATGDINGDGQDDVVMATNNGVNGKRIYVVFGSKKGWPQPPDVLTGSNLSASKGFRIDQGSAPNNINLIATGDVNGDGYSDIIIPYTSQSAAVVFGAPTWLTTNPGKGKLTGASRIALSDGYLDGTTGTKISMPHSDDVRQLATGNVDGDAYDDIVLMDDGSSAYVVLGKAEGTWTSSTSMTSEIYVSGVGDMSIHGLAVGNVNNDPYDDIVLPHGYASTQADILFGRTNWTTNSSWVGDAATVNGSLLALTTELGSATSAVRITNVTFNASPNTTITIGEVTGDAFNDIIIPNGSSVAIYAGSASWPATTSSATVDNSNISSAGPEPIVVGDVNSDGRNDLIIGGTTAAVYFQPSSGFANGTTWALDGSDGFSITNSLTPYTSAYTNYPALADLNYDGETDIVLGASGLPTTSQARISVVFGKSGWDSSVDLFQP